MPTLTDRLEALTQLAAAKLPEGKAAAIALGAVACVPGATVSALIFGDDAVSTAVEPALEAGFALRDNSLELRRLFLHALARFGDGASSFIERDRQRSFVGVTSAVGRSDWLFVPLIASGRTLGVIAVACDGMPEKRDDLVAFAALAAHMLDSERALAAAQRQSRDSQLLSMVNERLHKSLDRGDAPVGIVEGVRTAFGAYRCIVYERAAEGEGVAIAASASHASASMPNGSMPLDADLRKVFGGLTVRRDDFNGGEIYGDSTQSAIALPFVVDGRVEDALVLAFNRPRAFDDADIAALRSLAFHIGLALSNARLYGRERARRVQAESLERVVRILRDTQYVDEVVLVFAVTVSHELPLDCAAYAVEGDTLIRRALRMREQRGFEPASTVERAALEPFLVVDEPSNAMLLPRATRAGLFDDRDGVVVPLRLEGSLWGFFMVRAVDGGLDWTPDERATFFRTLGSHLEIALANAHAYERELRRAQERETLAEAARTILSHTAIGPLAGVMCRLASSLVRADRSCVLRWSGERYDTVGTFGEGIEHLISVSAFDLVHRAERLTSFATDDRRVQRLIDGPGYVVIPLAHSAGEGRETIDAFLLVGRDGEARFERDELRLLQELGALLALALRNLELYEAMSRANRALQESSEFKDDLLAMLAHDFKGPLTVILGYCELLTEAGDRDRDEIEMIYAQTKRLVRLSEDALVLAQTQSEGFSLARTVLDLAGFVAECADATTPNNPRLVVHTPHEIVPVELDAQRFRHVIDNLISNGLKYSTGMVEVNVRRSGEDVVIEVSDQGIGIPTNELTTLFTRFGRASNARHKGFAGSGIGLYLARKIVEVHRGTISVRSTENEGSTFVVHLPIASA